MSTMKQDAMELLETNHRVKQAVEAACLVCNISEKEFRNYLKELKIEKEFDRYIELFLELKPLASRLNAIYDELKSVFGKQGWESNVPSLYGEFSDIDLDKAMRWCCHQTAKKHESETDAGRMITDLKAKKRAAIDELHGINELDGLKIKVNNILQGADVPLLGQ